MKRLLGLVIAGVVLGVIFGIAKLKEGDRPAPTSADQGPVVHFQTQREADAIAKAAPMEPLRVDAHLPANVIDAKFIIWTTEGEVARNLGKGVKRPDGRHRHELGDGAWCLVVYDHGRAVGIELMTATGGWNDYSKEVQNEIAAKFGFAPDPKTWVASAGRKLTIRDDFGHQHLAVYDAEYIAEQDAEVERRVDEATARNAQRIVAQRVAANDAERLTNRRVEIVDTLNGLFRQHAVAQGVAQQAFAAQEGDEVFILTGRDVCDRTMLTNFAKVLDAFDLHIDKAFKVFRCSSGGERITYGK